jgi:hypothetical protein
MTAMRHITGAPNWQLAPIGAAPTAAAPAGDPSGLSAPSAITLGTLSDAMSALYALVDGQGNAQAKQAGVDVSWRDHQRHQAIDAQAAANQRLREAEGDGSKGFFSSIADTLSDAIENLATLDLGGFVEDSVNDTADMWKSPQFWKDLEVGAGYVAEAALVAGSAAVTCGAAAPVVAGIAIGLSAGGFAVEKTKCLDGVLGEGASKWVGLGMELTGAAAGGVASLAGQGGAAWLATISKVSNVAAGGATIAGGFAHGKVQGFAGDAMDASADATNDRNRAEQMERLVGWVIDGLKDTAESHQHALETVRQSMAIVDQTQLAPLLASGR